jgi:hypothetical protein
VAALPDVHEAVLALGALGRGADDLDVLLEAVVLDGGVGRGGGGLAEQAAEVQEVLVAGGALGELGAGPLFDELLRVLRRPTVARPVHGGDATGRA